MITFYYLFPLLYFLLNQTIFHFHVFAVEEGLTADWSAVVGYNDGEGAFWGGSVNQNNFLGTGNKMEASFSSSSSTDEYRFSYLNPYYTVDGVSRGIQRM